MGFNPSQLEAISHKNGPALILAGPGSGKTAVITQRTKNLILEHHINPSNILVITFTKSASIEMKTRFQKLMDGKNYPVTFGTFHAVYFAILKHAYHFGAENIIREEMKYQYMREIISHMHLEYEDENEFVTSILGEIGIVKNSLIALDNYYSANCPEGIFRQIYKEYDNRLRRNRLIDFDDMLVYTYELFKEREDILSAWQKKYQYILIDEFQDINKIQFDIIKMLARPQNNLFIVGDDDQSIYRFRGAKPEIMLHFPEEYKDAKQILLDTNYRSQSNIVKGATALIGHNIERYKKKIQANRKEMENIEYGLFKDQREENEKVIDQILDYVGRGGQYEDIAILFRTNTQPRLLMEQLMDYNIPFSTKDNIPNLYEHWIARDMFSYIRLAMGGRSRKDFLQIMNRPKRYIRRESIEEEQIAFDVLIHDYREQPWIAERIESLEYDLRVISRISPFAAINYIRQGIGYDDFCQEYADYRNIKVEDLYEVLEELQASAKGYKNFDDWFTHIEEYTKELEAQSKKNREVKNSVSLATLHSSKGLEYDIVYIVDVNEGIMPYKKAVLDAEIEEERRMFYVGMTRARDKLYLYSVKNLNNHEVDVSRFIKEINESINVPNNQ